ncbi:MAG: PLP-dependent aminotransferase family protein, partial [Acidimicrobiales bacterium]
AWQSLVRAGAVTARGRNGTYVKSVHTADGARRTLRTYESPGGLRLDLSTGIPDPALLPDLGRALSQVSAQRYTASYVERPVLPDLEAILRESWPFVPEEVTVVSGALDALDRLTTHLVRMGDRVLVENPCFPPLLDLLEMAGAEPIGLPLDDEGPQLEAIQAALNADPVVLYLQSRAHNPTGVSLSPSRARQIGRLLHGTRVRVVEDDHAGEISSSTLASIGSYLPAQTVHIRSFSKSHGPDLRMAAIGGAGDVIDGLNHRRLLGSGWSSRLLQAVLVELLTDDVSTTVVAEAREIYRERRRGMTKLLRERGVVTSGRDGINLWVQVPNEQRALVVLAAAGIGVAPGSPFLADPLDAEHVRLTVGLVPDDEAERVADALGLAG